MPHTDLQRLQLPRDGEDRSTDLYWRGESVTRDGDALLVPAGGTLDLGTWFNAAPVGWWRSLLGSGHLRLRVRGRGALTVFAGTAGRTPTTGTRDVVGRYDLDGTRELHLPRTEGTDWYWIALEGGADGGRLEAVEWASGGGLGRNRGRATRVTVVSPTYRRETDCLEQVVRLLDPALAETVGHVVVVDQGDSLRAADTHGVLDDARVVLIEQPNLGGSGGYGRGMRESLRWPDDPVLLLDDDAEIAGESLRRLHALSMQTREPTILGTGLVSAEDGTTLEALAEKVDRRTFHWGAADCVASEPVDTGSPDRWSFTHASDRAEYTGWWGTFLPAGTVARLGLPAPYFLKWDDAEYGLRARRAGVLVAAVPGINVWHPTWAAKGSLSSWSSWPMHRNRLATAAAYGSGRGVVRDSLLHQVKHVLSLQYTTVELWNAALAEVLDGPGWMSGDLTAVRPRAQALLDELPPARSVPDGGRVVRLPSPAEFGWRDGLRASAVVFEDGSAPLVRDRARARRLLSTTLRLHGRALRRWRSLRSAYAAALPQEAAAEAWEARFDG
ncbi:glycosyltransferase [Paraoerskovia marina]|uniref:glycosyltransferase n=1 Tax=Paraoerskovia marina TaxID=545619 RepID=UPI0004927C5D|nr:glycosyltransferase [Paraoerskovia marina]